MRLLTEFHESLRIAWEALRSHKLRSVLTTLGIVIGIVTVTLMGTAIDGLKRAFMQSISSIGADVLYVQRFAWQHHSFAEWIKVQNRREITLAQVRVVEKQMTRAQAVAPYLADRQPVRYKNRRSDGVNVIGTSDQFLFTGGVSVAQGRFLSAAEAAGGRPVCVIGAQVATNLFLREPPLGNTIRVGPDHFEVIGVLEKQGSVFGQFSLDNQVIIPIQQFRSSFRWFADFQIQVKVKNLPEIEEARDELRGLLRTIRRVPPGAEDDFAINQQEMILRRFNSVAGTIATVGFCITGLALFVGGIGIMNIMFVSVAERTREIGIRKAIGAKRRAILLQFLGESASISLLGGLVGLAIAWPLTLVMARFLPARMSLTVVGLALLVSLMTGVASGFFPAWRAARMNPVDALRNE